VGRVRSSDRRPKRGRLILVIGGASSGKSDLALSLAGNSGARAFVATGQALDEEMAERIRRHKASRGVGWETAEVPVELAEWFQADGWAFRAVVVDCLTLWLTNLQGSGAPESEVSRLVSALLKAIRGSLARVVVVTNELGLGLVPEDADCRRFRDLAGQVNQQIAREADEVYLALSGLPVRIKPAVGIRSYGRAR
jgi:adenosylcobinamide kinase / adenosylcobinamide-phosphate guanylyltransferase